MANISVLKNKFTILLKRYVCPKIHQNEQQIYQLHWTQNVDFTISPDNISSNTINFVYAS
jgi:hypothetical protein